MLFTYKALDQQGNEREGTIDALSQDAAISALQRRNLIVSSIKAAEKKSILSINLFGGVSTKEVVILSRQIATLFEAQVSALRVFRLLASEVDNKTLASVLAVVSDDVQSGNPISKALSKHPKVFSSFYVNMVKAGEDSGKLSETFLFLADYLDRTYEVMSKAQNALIYPAFVIVVFITVMGLMLTMVIPRISAILLESGQDIPIYTKIVIGASNFLVNYGLFLIIALVVAAFFVYRYSRTGGGSHALDDLKLSVPYIGNLYEKLYLSRIADNLSTMLLSGISVVDAVETTAAVVGNRVYQNILQEAAKDIQGGMPISDALARHPRVPGIMIAMMRIGEETGELGNILTTLGKFYRREVSGAVDTLVGLIEPAMIVFLALGVGTLLASVLVPIYNISAGAL
jgi:type IV pilus assembly protein PilC